MSPDALMKLRRERVQETFQLDPLVIITLKGHDYTLEFNNFTVKCIYKELGINLLSEGIPMEAMQDPDKLGKLLLLGLQEHHPDLTQDAVDRLYTYRHYMYVLDRLQAALNLFMPDMSDVEKPTEPDAGKPVLVQDPSKPLTRLG
jgi:hypothetical protein